MGFYTDSCTIYNRYLGSDRLDHWQRTVVNGVMWDSVSGISKRKNGITNADSVVVIIPHKVTQAPKYLPPKAFETLADKARYWTLKPGDKIVKGEIAYEITGTNTIAKLEKQFDEVFDITTVDNRPFGSLAHWEVGGK